MSRWEPVLTDLVQYRGGSLLRYATLLCGDQREAEDLVQDALIKVFTVRRPLRAGQDESGALDHAEAYVRRTILHAYIDGYRRRLRWVAVRHLVGVQTRTAGPDQGGPERLDLQSALAALPPKQRFRGRSGPKALSGLGRIWSSRVKVGSGARGEALGWR